MEHLETQVSDLRSFLPAATTSTSTAAPIPIPVLVPAPDPMTATAAAATATTAARHSHPPPSLNPARSGSQAVTASPASAFGPNSAHPSPTSTTTAAPYVTYPQHAHPHTPRNLSLTPSSAYGGGPGGAPLPPSAASAAAGSKRKADGHSDDAAQKQQRSKRNRYISIACNECKRRKIKCNGETPCQRCGNLNLQCLYAPNCCSNSFKDSDEFRHMSDSLARLQEQMETLQRNMTALQQETLHLAPIQDRNLPLPINTASSNLAPSPSTSGSSSQRPDLAAFRPPLLFRGPTSASSHVDVAKTTLHNMGYSGAEGMEDNGVVLDDTPAQSPMPAPSTEREPSRHPPDPLWEYDVDEMIRLCRLHEEEVGIMYPVVNINDVIAHARLVSRILEEAKRNGLVHVDMGRGGGVSDINSLELKIIMCCALVVQENGYSVKANRLWESIQPIADRMLMSDPSDVANLPFLALVAGYRFLANEEVLAWRVMGQVARLCLEMGLHRRDGIKRITGEQERKNAINTFWSAYVLDRRWSFGTGFPFVVHDDKIDPGLPYPEEHPYLNCLISFAKLSSKIWRLVDYFDSALIRDLKREDFERMDEEILEWYDTVPESIRISCLDNHVPVPGTPRYNVERLQIWTRLRLNQIRIWLYTPVLHTASSITQNIDFAQRVVDLAKETIQYLTFLNNNSIIYRRIQVFYHHFLLSAIAVLFLASTHAPVSFSSQCCDEYHMALELVKDLSAKSWVSQRLWRTVRSIKAYEPWLGLQQDEDPRRRENAALTMAGMAANGHDTQHGMPSSSAHRGSGSSSGYQPTPNPGQTSVHGGSHQHTPNNTGMSGSALHGGRNSPRSAGGGQTQNQGQPGSTHTDDKTNGLLLQTEMSRIFEVFVNGAARGGAQPHSGDGPDVDSHEGQLSRHPYGRRQSGPADASDSIYPHIAKGLF